MSLLFNVESLVSGGVNALQEAQRDFSPFLMHLTSAKAMIPVNQELTRLTRKNATPTDVSKALRKADTASLRKLNQIIKSGSIRHGQFHPDFPDAVCLTECTLPGILGHAGRYGRYGVIFKKSDLYALGARPVAYVDDKRLKRLRSAAQAAPTNAALQADLMFSNMFRPSGGKVQNYTHEREWRCPVDVPLDLVVGVIIPSLLDVKKIRAAFLGGRAVLPLNFLYQLGT